MTGLSRRNALRAAGAGGLGLAVATAAVGQAAAATPGVPETTSATTVFTLTGAEIRAVGPRRKVGDQAVVTGTVRSGTQETTGEFFAQSTVVNRRNLLTDAIGMMQTHTFVLAQGTLVGAGVLSHDGTGTFAVVGGTLAFQGISGSYVVQQDLDDFAATATYTFTVTTPHSTGKAFL